MYITITPESEVTRHEGIPDLQAMYDAIGTDTVEAVGFNQPEGEPFGCVGWLDENGKIANEPKARNDLATRLAHRFEAIREDDYIAGVLLLTGGADEDGETTSLPSSWANRVEDAVAEFTGVRQTV